MFLLQFFLSAKWAYWISCCVFLFSSTGVQHEETFFFNWMTYIWEIRELGFFPPQHDHELSLVSTIIESCIESRCTREAVTFTGKKEM